MPSNLGVQLTDIFLRKLKPSGKREEISDTSERGLRVRISVSGDISFIVKSRGADSKVKTVTLGRYPDLSLKTARERATKVRQALKDGVEINDEKRVKRRLPSESAHKATLRDLLIEYETRFSSIRRIWSCAGVKTKRSEARIRIETVFSALLERPAEDLTEGEFAKEINGYKRAKPIGAKTTANGQVSRARAYLMPVLDWAAGRRRFAKIGSSRQPNLKLAELHDVIDPSTNDHSIKGERDRVLDQDELQSVLPLLTYPAPKLGKLRVRADDDYRPVAMRFMLFTAARREEIQAMKWRDIDFANKVWRKPEVKSTLGAPRSQTLPLSHAAIDILKSLPQAETTSGEEYVFPNSTGGRLGNWNRFQQALFEASNTKDWHRHDLRRTAATLMLALQVPPTTIEKILAHKDPLRHQNVGGAAATYMRLANIIKSWTDPQAEALNQLATVLHWVEGGGAVPFNQQNVETSFL